jgi:hypothetical protein
MKAIFKKKEAKIQSGCCMRAMRMRRGSKNRANKGDRRKRREAPSWRWHLRRDGCEEHPKIIIMVVRI